MHTGRTPVWRVHTCSKCMENAESETCICAPNVHIMHVIEWYLCAQTHARALMHMHPLACVSSQRYHSITCILCAWGAQMQVLLSAFSMHFHTQPLHVCTRQTPRARVTVQSITTVSGLVGCSRLAPLCDRRPLVTFQPDFASFVPQLLNVLYQPLWHPR